MSGALFQSNKDYAPGTKLKTSIVVNNETLHFYAIVRWCKTGTTENTTLIGLQFDLWDAENRKIIEHYIQNKAN